MTRCSRPWSRGASSSPAARDERAAVSVFGFALGPAASAVEARLRALDQQRFAARLWEHDATLWGADPGRTQVAANRLGWLEVARTMEREIPALESFAAEAAREGFTRAVLLGMGGSSLAPEVMRGVLGVRPGRLELTV